MGAEKDKQDVGYDPRCVCHI